RFAIPGMLCVGPSGQGALDHEAISSQALVALAEPGTLEEQMQRFLVCSIALAAIALPSAVAAHSSKTDTRAAIQALEERFAAAVRAKDLDAIMKVYAPGSDLFVFDVVPPRQYVGADAYRKDWKGFLDTFKGSVKFTVSDLSIDAAGK